MAQSAAVGRITLPKPRPGHVDEYLLCGWPPPESQLASFEAATQHELLIHPMASKLALPFEPEGLVGPFLHRSPARPSSAIWDARVLRLPESAWDTEWLAAVALLSEALLHLIAGGDGPRGTTVPRGSF